MSVNYDDYGIEVINKNGICVLQINLENDEFEIIAITNDGNASFVTSPNDLFSITNIDPNYSLKLMNFDKTVTRNFQHVGENYLGKRSSAYIENEKSIERKNEINQKELRNLIDQQNNFSRKELLEVLDLEIAKMLEVLNKMYNLKTENYEALKKFEIFQKNYCYEYNLLIGKIISNVCEQLILKHSNLKIDLFEKTNNLLLEKKILPQQFRDVYDELIIFRNNF